MFNDYLGNYAGLGILLVIIYLIVSLAAIGVFTGRRVVQWQHTNPGNRVDRWLLGVSVRSVGGGGRVVVPIVVPVR